MSTDDNIKAVTAVYEAFGRGDIPAILDALSDDVDWSAEAASSGAPWYGARRGKDEVLAFFEAYGSTMETEDFEPLSIAGNDTDVFAIVRFRTKSLATGKTAAMNLHHYFKFADGKIVYYRGSEDTAQTEAVLQA